jgi:quercetin dioxygenase-like cupin family protein
LLQYSNKLFQTNHYWNDVDSTKLDRMESSHTPSPPPSAIPPDDPTRPLTLARPNEDMPLRHVSIAGDTYTLLVMGDDTAGRYCLIDMFVPPGGGPPPHRHDFEEMFTVLEGAIEVTFRGTTSTARTGETVNVPANAPHMFRNASAQPARLLCMCSPPGQERFFLEVGDPVSSRTAPPPTLSESERAARVAKAEALAPRYRTELLKP